MWGLLRKVRRDLSGRPARSLLTVLGIAIAVGGLVATVSTVRNLERAQRALFETTSQADIVYWVWNAPQGVARLLEADRDIRDAELRASYLTRWRADDRWRDIELIGIDDFGDVRINQFDVVEGRPPGPGEIMVDSSASSATGARPGDEIVYRGFDGRDQVLRVSGISRSPGRLASSITSVDVGYVPGDLARRLLNTPGNNRLLIRLWSPTDSQAVIRRVERTFRRLGLQAGAPQIREPDRYPGKRELDALVAIMFLFSAMGLVLSSFLVINTLSAIVAEQVNEIGIIKALGASRQIVLLLYLLEALTYGVVGTLVGIGLGALLGWQLLAWIGELGNARVAFQLAPEGVLLGVAVGIVVSLIGGIWPAFMGARLSPREAMASYGIRSDYGQGWLDRRLVRIRRIPPLAAMAIRNLGRRTGRTTLTILVVALATAGALGALSTQHSVDAAISGVYATYRADAWVWLGQNVSTLFAKTLTTVDGVEVAEGWALADGIVALGEARLWGIPSGSALYRHVLRDGRWYRPDESDVVVVSSELADDRNISVGDRVEIQLNDRIRQYDVVGVAIDNTIFLGGDLAGKAFLPRSALLRLLGQEGHASFFALGLESSEPDKVDEVLAEVERRFMALRPGVQPVYDEIATAEAGSHLLTVALLAMVVIVTLVGSLGILNTQTLNVMERQREIAVMRVMGAGDQAIALTFISEGLVLGFCGWLSGVAIGLVTGYAFTRQLSHVLFSLDYVVLPSAVLASFAFTLVLATVASIGPALAAARTSASVGLRYE